MSFWLYLIGGITLLVFALKKYLGRNENYWEKRGTPKVISKTGSFKALWLLFTRQKNISEFDKDRYFGLNGKFGGTIDFGTPTLMLKDPDLIKQVLVKDFDHFVDRRRVQMDGEPLFKQMLVNLESQEWKNARALMSPTFTTGKIRRMFEMFNKSGSGLVEFIKKTPVGSPGSRDINIKEVINRYLVDVIAKTAFGMEMSTLQDKNSVFYKYSQKASKFSALRLLKLILLTLFPFLSKLGLKFLDTESMDFFTGVLRQALEKRAGSDKKDDFLQLMLEARKGELKEEEGELEQFEKDAELKGVKKRMEMDDEMILAQCLLFFLAGVDTTGALLGFSYYLLALHPEIQEKLWREVKEGMEGGKVSFDELSKMEYLDWFISEVLRLYPPAQRLERRCTKPYTIPGSNTVIEKDALVWVPMIGLHMDEKYYPEPEKFNPERFAPDERAKRHAYSYLPFGQGPRNCIGMRFALMEAKVAIAYIVYNFAIEPSTKTPIPIKVDPNIPGRPDTGVEFRFKERVN